MQATLKVAQNELSDVTTKILQAASGSFGHTNQPGALWATADVSLECKRDGGHLRSHTISLTLSFRLHWNETSSYPGGVRSATDRARSQLALSFFREDDESLHGEATDGEKWSPLDFYNAAHVPDKTDPSPLSIEIPNLTATLFPYQKRTLQWLLQREGVAWSQSADGGRPGLKALDASNLGYVPKSFREVEDINGRKAFLSDLYQLVTTDVTPFAEAEVCFRGGILAEEMGLGKTLEMIGLIMLHRRGDHEHGTGPSTDNLSSTPATLIVTPDSLRPQWISELRRHAPHLRVKHYTGCKALTEEGERELVADLISHDVVVTTYGVMAAEVHFAEKPPNRSMRQERKYHRPKSPLAQISWWRVCLDEAQMIESGVSNAASVARLLPRMNSWGITGTPVKSNVKDLLGLLQFLRYQPFASHPQIWDALIKNNKTLFRELFGRIALRHTKRMVRDEIALPVQRRFIITMPFAAVEEQHYQSLFRQMTSECGLDANGAPLVDDWDLEKYEPALRVWLARLRQAALHPELGFFGRRVLGNKAGPMRTVEEVLDAMIEQSDGAIRNDQRAIFAAKLARGQLLENGPRVRDALSIWESVKDEAAAIVAECRASLKVAIEEARNKSPEQFLSRDGVEDSESEDEPEE